MRYTICRIARRCYKVFTTHGQKREREAVTMSDYAAIEKEARIFTEECVTNNRIDPTLFAQYDIKRGLRDKNGKGVLAGITNISRIDAFEERDGQKVPCEGKLWYRGYNVYDLIRGLRGKRYAFEGAAYLLLLELHRLPCQMPRPADKLCARRHHEGPQSRPDELADPQRSDAGQLR